MMISILSQIVEFRNGESGAHVLHINIITELILERLIQKTDQYDLSSSVRRMIVTASALHDIGKIGIPDRILNKPEKLTDEEYGIMKSHVTKGAEILKSFTIVDHVEEGALYHHERYDGKGYPYGLKGNEIDLFSGIVAIADVYDAMTAARCYRGPLCPFRVIEMFEVEGFQKYDVSILLPFLENVVNSCLQNRCLLSDGRKGTIIYINKDKLSRPVVQCGGEYVNLADQPDLEIVRLL